MERYKEWQVKNMASGGQESVGSESESDEEGIVAGIAQFEARQKSEVDKFVRNLGVHNEAVVMHLNTIHENEEESSEEEKVETKRIRR
jgi:hypothetical protein